MEISFDIICNDCMDIRILGCYTTKEDCKYYQKKLKELGKGYVKGCNLGFKIGYKCGSKNIKRVDGKIWNLDQ